LLTLS
jgi:hypothetical protein